eukprot:TRINITY_DN38802_c0_g1_i1.p1 TRINITY_DN38802_c0_g1~~TRINITY_DN38802_c0_g1_i1.p1  ORF type:complete len:245 (+),score=58.37 TRINITY_DN38802_c0_g1_i1:84-818(+)
MWSAKKNPYLKRKPPKGPDTDPKRIATLDAMKEMMESDTEESIKKFVLHMKDFYDDAEIMREAVYSLATKAIQQYRAVISQGGLEAGLIAMNRHGQNERLQFDGCELLWRLSMEEDGREEVLNQNGLQAVLGALSLHTESVRVMEEACGALRWLAEKEPKRVMDDGGLDAVLRVMNMQMQYSWVQMWGCGAILCFAQIDPKSVQDLGGFTTIQEALKRHGNCPEVVRLGQLALKLDPAVRKTLR